MKDGAYPVSASSFLVNLAGGVAFLAALSLLQKVWVPEAVYLSLGGLAAAIATLLAGEIFFLKSHRRERVGLRTNAARNWPVIATKILSYNITLALVAIGYYLIPEYQQVYYEEFHLFLLFLLPVAVIVGNTYILLFDHRLGSPDDGLLHFGYLVTGQWKMADRTKIAEYFKSVGLRAYFVPAMYIYVVASLETFVGGPADYLKDHSRYMVDIPVAGVVMTLMLSYFFLMVIDALFALIGYLMTFKVLNSDVRSTDTTIIGWVSCIICYTPFFEVMLAGWLLRDFYHNPQWFVWFQSNAWLMLVWGSLTTIAMCTEAFTTMTFGIRFSNLTYRGLMSTGLFRFTKHPQYVSKMVNRFLVFVPFLSWNGVAGAAWTMFLFTLISLLYYIRARTEENHLSIHEDYVRYAELMNERSLFSPVARLLPFLRYSREKALRHRLF